MPPLPAAFPFAPVFTSFLEEYSRCTTYWYVPKTRALNDGNVDVMRQVLSAMFEHHLQDIWDQETQDALLRELVATGVLQPYEDNAKKQDRTALMRIWKKFLEMFGLVWIEENQQLLVTDAGLELLESESAAPEVVRRQVSKLQYPAPWMGATDYSDGFRGIVPSVFLLQVLAQTDWHLDYVEYELFVNLAQSHDDLDRIVNYVNHWRQISEKQQTTIRGLVEAVPMAVSTMTLPGTPVLDPDATRYRRITLNGAYQRALYTYFPYLDLDSSKHRIFASDQATAVAVLADQLSGFQVPTFTNRAEWIFYMGDPSEEPTWFTLLRNRIDQAEVVPEETEVIPEAAKASLSADEQRELVLRQKERLIESFFAENLDQLEAGLSLVDGGRQFITPIGRLDLLCRDEAGVFVVVEVKVGEAEDAVFGQILRYIGWVHGNMGTGNAPVRGIILAGNFSEKARMSRMGLLKPDASTFLKFKQHGLAVSDA